MANERPSPGDCRCCCCWNRPVSHIMIFSFVSAIGLISSAVGWFSAVGSLRPIYEEFPDENDGTGTKLSGWNNSYAGLFVESEPFGSGVRVKFCRDLPKAFCAVPSSAGRNDACFIGGNIEYETCESNEAFQTLFLTTCPKVESKIKSIVNTEIATAVFCLITVLTGLVIPWVFVSKWKKPEYEKLLTGESPGYQPGASTNDIPQGYPWFIYIFVAVYTVLFICYIIIVATVPRVPECSLTGKDFKSPRASSTGTAFNQMFSYVIYCIVFLCVSCCWYGGWKEKYDSWISRMEQERAIEMANMPTANLIVGPDGIPVLQQQYPAAAGAGGAGGPPPLQQQPVPGTVIPHGDQQQQNNYNDNNMGGLPPMLAAQQQQQGGHNRSEEEEQPQWPSNPPPPQGDGAKEQPHSW